MHNKLAFSYSIAYALSDSNFWMKLELQSTEITEFYHLFHSQSDLHPKLLSWLSDCNYVYVTIVTYSLLL